MAKITSFVVLLYAHRSRWARRLKTKLKKTLKTYFLNHLDYYCCSYFDEVQYQQLNYSLLLLSFSQHVCREILRVSRTFKIAFSQVFPKNLNLLAKYVRREI